MAERHDRGPAAAGSLHSVRVAAVDTIDVTFSRPIDAATLTAADLTLTRDGQPVPTPRVTEYANLYAHFASLVRGRRSDVDYAPLQLVADAFLCGRRIEVEPFVE